MGDASTNLALAFYSNADAKCSEETGENELRPISYPLDLPIEITGICCPGEFESFQVRNVAVAATNSAIAHNRSKLSQACCSRRKPMVS